MKTKRCYIQPDFRFVAVSPSDSYCVYVSIVGNEVSKGDNEAEITESGGYRGLWDSDSDEIFK